MAIFKWGIKQLLHSSYTMVTGYTTNQLEIPNSVIYLQGDLPNAATHFITNL